MLQASRDPRARAEGALTDFADRLERFFRENYTTLVRRHLRFGTVEDVQDALQEVMLRIFQRFADGEQAEPENLAAFVNVAVRNALIDRRRRGIQIPFSDLAPAGDDGETGADSADPPFLLAADPQHLDQEEELAWKQLLRTIFDRLPPKWVEVAAMVMGGKTPPEIGAAFGQNGYVLRRYARQLICQVLADLSGRGDPLARSAADNFCAGARDHAGN